ncbi:response regulator [Nocardia takedensis]
MSQQRSGRTPNQPRTPDGTKAVSVLVVEDDRAIAEMIEIVLGGQGLAVYWCGSGREAVSTARRVESVLALVDLRLPDRTGIDVCGDLRAHGASVIVTMSAARDPELIAEAAAAGACEHLVKPFTMQQLVECVSAHLPAGPSPGVVRAPTRPTPPTPERAQRR